MYYVLEELKKLIALENPTMKSADIDNKAKLLHRAFNTMDVSWRRSNKKFYNHVDLYCDLGLKEV